MKQSDIKILLGILCVAIIGGVYMYVFKPNMDDKKSLDSEIDTLQEKYDELNAKQKDRDKYEKETAENIEKFRSELDKFPASLAQERTVMFVKGVDEREDFDISSTGLGQQSLFFTLSPAPDDELGENYECYSAAFPISYQGTYEGVKDLVQYIMDYPERMNITSISIAYDSEADMCSGSLSLNAYCISGNGRTDADVNVNVPTGVENIFIGGEGATTSGNYKYDADNGAALKDDKDIEISLVNANNDLTDGVIVAAGTDKVSSSENEVVDVKLTVEEDGDEEYLVTYAIGDKSYSVKTKKDVKIYVKSSERVDDNDKNGVKLSVDNSTDAPVFILVDGDDEASPRFNLGGIKGKVKVY